jgi:hypothetical protein
VHERFVDLVELIARVHLRDRAGPGAGTGGFRIETLAVPELQIPQAYQAGLAGGAARLGERNVEQVIGGAEARVPVGHRGRGYRNDANLTWAALWAPGERMGSVWLARPFRARFQVD